MIQTGERRFYGCFAFRKGVDPAGRGVMRQPQSRSSSSASSSPTPPTARHARRAWAKPFWETVSSSGPAARARTRPSPPGRLGADVTFITRLGRDPFADMAMATWKEAGVKPAVIETPESYTGAAYIFVEETTGNNAIIVAPARRC